jgi:hypothetical protein
LIRYVTWSGDLELVNRASDESETALQRYNRLNCEVNELWEEVNGIRKAAEGDEKGDKKGDAAANLVAAKVSTLQDELSKMRLEETLGTALVKNLEVRDFGI